MRKDCVSLIARPAIVCQSACKRSLPWVWGNHSKKPWFICSVLLMSIGLCESLVSTAKRIQSVRFLLRVEAVRARACPIDSIRVWLKAIIVAKTNVIILEYCGGSVIIASCWESLLNQASIRRFIFTLITGYLAIFGVQQIPYEFPNQWAVLIPVLIVVYIVTVWLDGVFFKDEEPLKESERSLKTKKNQLNSKSRGFGN